MNTKNNLHNALNKAFENHQEPLNEAQWDRLQGVLSKRKKRRIFPFFLLLMVISFTAGTTYILTLNYGLKNREFSAFPTKQKQNTQNNQQIENKDLALINKENSALNTPTISSFTENTVTAPHSFKPKKAKYKSNVKAKEFDQAASSEIPDPENIAPNKDIALDIPQKEGNFEEPKTPEKTMDMEIVLKNTEPTYPTNPKDKEDDIITSPPSKFAFLFAVAGYSKMNVKVSGIENSEKLHKDTRKLFEESNKNLKTQFLSLGFDWNILPRFRIGINSGIQYLRVETPVNINYELIEVPFWDSRHSQIIGYADYRNKPHLQLNANTTNYTTYITLPLRINYSIPITPKNEILVTAGANFCGLANAKGQSLTINKELNHEPTVKPISNDMYRRLNLGFAGGVQYSTRFKDNWWLGMEGLRQTNNLKYKTGYGSIKNKLEGYSVNILIKYKI